MGYPTDKDFEEARTHRETPRQVSYGERVQDIEKGQDALAIRVTRLEQLTGFVPKEIVDGKGSATGGSPAVHAGGAAAQGVPDARVQEFDEGPCGRAVQPVPGRAAPGQAVGAVAPPFVMGHVVPAQGVDAYAVVIDQRRRIRELELEVNQARADAAKAISLLEDFEKTASRDIGVLEANADQSRADALHWKKAYNALLGHNRALAKHLNEKWKEEIKAAAPPDSLGKHGWNVADDGGAEVALMLLEHLRKPTVTTIAIEGPLANDPDRFVEALTGKKRAEPMLTVPLPAIQRMIHENAVAKGWWEGGPEKRNIPEMLMLIVSEVAEALEHYRDGAPAWMTFPSSMKGDVLHAAKHGNTRDAGFANRIHDALASSPEAKPDGFPIEIADIVIRCFDLCGGLGIDLSAAMAMKHRYNVTRPHRHGGKKA